MKKIIILAVLLPALLALAGDLTVDNLTVSNNAAIHGKLDFYSISSTTTNTNSVSATGGTITTNGNYRIHTFTNNGTFEVSAGSITCDVLVVAGGGGGGSVIGGGGGAGGLLFLSNISVSVGSYTVTVGNGGGGGTWSHGTNGADSVFGTNTAIGGGGGGHNNGIGGNGGSGGGSDREQNTPGTGVSGQGNGGGYASTSGNFGSGGGGGAGAMGGTGTGSTGGNGGVGLEYSQFNGSGSPAGWFAGGGGGAIYSSGSGGSGGNGGGGAGSTADGFDAVANTGGGGGGADRAGGANAGNGGSGIVIVRYSINQSSSSSSNITTMSISSNGINQTGTSGANVFMSNVGIGTNNPVEKLHVAGNLRVDGTSIVSAVTLGGVPITNWSSIASGVLMASNNLSDVENAVTARSNLGLGSAATYDANVFLTTNGNGATLTNITAAQVGAVSTNDGVLLSANNLSDVANAGTARDNLGLGSAATNDANAFLSTAGGEINGNVAVDGAVMLVAPAGDIPMGVYTNY